MLTFLGHFREGKLDPYVVHVGKKIKLTSENSKILAKTIIVQYYSLQTIHQYI